MKRRAFSIVALVLLFGAAVQAQIAPLVITTSASLPSATVGSFYSVTLSASGGTLPYRNWSIVEYSLPLEFVINSSTGVLTGTPTSAGSRMLQISVDDGGTQSASKIFSLTVNSPPLAITTTSPLPSGVVGAPYSQTVFATGGFTPYRWSLVSGLLPPGLFLSASGAISGTPSTAGSYSFSARVTDSQGAIVTRTFALTIASGGTTQGPDGEVGVSYRATLVALSGTPPFTWTITSGQLPPGLTLNGSTGVISGPPTTAGTFNFVAQWTDNQARTFPNSFSIRIYPALTITTPSPLPGGILGVAYSQQIGVGGGKPPYSASIAGSLPAGLTFDPAALVIGGTPTALGTFSFNLTVSDGLQPVTKQFSITVAGRLSITTTSPLPSGTVGVQYSQTLAATGGTPPYINWRIVEGILPSGLSLSTAGLISGTPLSAGSGIVQISVNDGTGQSASKVFDWSVNLASLSITTASPLPGATVGVAYSQTFAATGGTGSYSWSVPSGLPAGLSLSQAGLLSGTPTAAGTYAFTVTVNGAASKQFTLVVTVPPTLSVTGLDAVSPDQQPPIDVQLKDSYSLEVRGTIRLAFTPDAVVPPAGNPQVQFSTGGTTKDFTIRAGETRAFPTSPPAIQTGTVAGRINLTLDQLTVGGQPVSPLPTLTPSSVTIPRSAPKIISVQVTNKTSSGFSVVVAGYSTPRQVTQAVFSFTAASGANLQTTQLTVPVDPAFTTWYSGPSSTQFGSLFLYTQPFTLQGDAAAIASVSVTLSNSTGSSQAASANF